MSCGLANDDELSQYAHRQILAIDWISDRLLQVIGRNMPDRVEARWYNTRYGLGCGLANDDYERIQYEHRHKYSQSIEFLIDYYKWLEIYLIE